MMYQLEIQTDGQFVPVCKSGDPEKLWKRKEKERAIQFRSTGHRIFRADRKRNKNGELAGGPRGASRYANGGTPCIKYQAKQLAEHILKIKQKTIHVFPLGKTSNTLSNQFRLYLFSAILGTSKTWPCDRDRVKCEDRLTELGYTIIEVDPDAYR
jgi:hypothetical protein